MMARAVLSDLDTEAVLSSVLGSARGLTGARYAALGVLDETRTELSRFLTLGVDGATRRLIEVQPRGRGVLGELIREPRPLRLDNVSRHPYPYGFPLGHPPMSSFLGVPILVGGQPFANLYLADKQGSTTFSDADEEAVVLLAGFAGVAIDHARRYTRSERRRVELERTVAALDATTEIAKTLGGEIDLQTILDLVAKRGRVLVSARAVVIELERDHELEVAAVAGHLPGALVGRRVKLSDTVAADALRTRQTQRLDDELHRARFAQYGLGRFGVSADQGLAVPLAFRDRAYGLLVALDREHGHEPFSDHDQRMLEAFATSAAAALATASSAADHRWRHALAAAEAERGRWARELHDETLQSLGNLSTVLATGRRAGQPAEMASALGRALDQLDIDIANLRALITELHPAALDELGIAAALEVLAARVAMAGLRVDIAVGLSTAQEACIRATELETAMYRIVQEALTNAVRHGHARQAIVQITADQSTLIVTVCDDGRGFDPSTRTSGFGLLGMRERSELLHGDLNVRSSPDQGTTVTAAFRLSALAGIHITA
jgi:signal transduction histidine kinase